MTREQLIQQIFAKKSFLCVGLDTDAKKIPAHLLDLHDPIVEFNKAIIDATAPYCVAYKPNLAFYEAHGIHGMTAFKKTVEYIQEHHPHHFIIADAKRGEMFKDVRRVAPRHFLLVPGVGAQGGSLEEVCRYGMTSDCGLLVNSSRGIIYASNGEDFAEIAANKAREIQQQMTVELERIV